MKIAQHEMRRAYVNGAPGVLVSGLVWLTAGYFWSQAGVSTAFAVLFFGGMLIMPLAIVVARKAFHAPKLKSGHPLDRLSLESTFLLFVGILVAYTMLRTEPQSVFPILATTMGARYFIFRTIYAEPLYWLLAAAIVAVGGGTLLYIVLWPINLAVVVGALEIIFATALFYRSRGVVSDAR